MKSRTMARPGLSEQGGGRGGGRWRVVVVGGLFTLVGINLRSVILAVPPVLPQITHDLSLSYTETGLLTSLPTLIMGGLALPAGLLAGRMGARASVAVGLALLAVGTFLRAVFPAALPLYLFTALLSLGIAVAQTAMPVLARQWFPTRIGLISALYSNGLILGEALAAGVTGSLILGVFGHDAWPATFVVWSIPVVVMLALWLALAPAAPALNPRVRSIRATSTAAGAVHPVHVAASRPRVNPLHLGILLGCASLIFFGMNGWIATYNVALHRDSTTALALFVLNAAQLPVSLGMIPFAQRLAGRRWPFITAGIVCGCAIAAWWILPASAEVFSAALLGGGSAFVFVLGIALPALLAGRSEVARLTGITLTLSYTVAFVGPLLGGGLWDLFGVPALAFAPVLAAGVTLIVLGALLPARSAFGLVDEAA
ncbi:MAG: CynX/NimT family MFS transporter [Ktedonobacterales bacterium]